MSQDKKFYVYVHRYASGPKQGKVFYVGKGGGSKTRSTSRYGRNSHWHNIVKKYGFSSEIVMRFYNEECAYSIEVSLISFYGIENLCNISTGGAGGATGRKNSKEHIRKVSEFHRGRKRTPNTCDLISKAAKYRLSNPKNHWHTKQTVSTWWNSDGRVITGTHLYLSEITGIKLELLKKVQSGIIFSYKGWKVAGVRNYSYKMGVNNNKSKKNVFVCKKEGFPNFIGCKSDFCKFYNYSSNKTYALFSGKCKTMDGWTVYEL